jgi:hypothetical protein
LAGASTSFQVGDKTVLLSHRGDGTAFQANRLVGRSNAVLVIDDTAAPKGQAHGGSSPQYASALGKTANCQTLLSLTLARDEVPVMPVLRLLLPESWTSKGRDDAHQGRLGGAVGAEQVVSGRVEPLVLPACSPDLNAYAERWVRSMKEECLSKVILFGDRSLRRALTSYVEHYHAERNHQRKGNVLLFPEHTNKAREGPVQCRERLGGLLRYYHREAA